MPAGAIAATLRWRNQLGNDHFAGVILHGDMVQTRIDSIRWEGRQAAAGLRPVAFPVISDAVAFTDSNSIMPGHEDNQDSFLYAPESGMFAVADGVGGRQAGKRASSLVIDLLRNETGVITDAESARRFFAYANSELKRAGAAAGTPTMSTTLSFVKVLGRIDEGRTDDRCKVLFANVGDSPIYLVSGNRIMRMYDLMRSEPGNYYALANWMGMGSNAVPHVEAFDCRIGDEIVLCTDGVSDNLEHMFVDTPSNAAMLRETLDVGARYLVFMAIAKKAKPDDATAVVARLRQAYDRRPSHAVRYQADR